MSKRIPSYRLHKPSGRAVVTIKRKDHYLGPHGSPESYREYDRVIAEYLAGRADEEKNPQTQQSFTVAEVIAQYLDYCERYYGPMTDRKSQTYNLRPVLRQLNRLYGEELARDFGPKKLKALREGFIRLDNCRKYINSQVERIKRMFKWACSEELVPPDVLQALQSVAGLRKGHTEARESEKVTPVPEDIFLATAAKMGQPVGDMAMLQWHTGMRPEEVCILRPMDIERTGDVWTYRPQKHKTEHHDHDRTVAIGPKGQAVLQKYLLRAETDYCFIGQFGNRYNTGTYRREIHRACDRAKVTRWGPNRLRHSKGTIVREKMGLEAAQVTLGHQRADVTQVYAERNRQLAEEVARKLG